MRMRRRMAVLVLVALTILAARFQLVSDGDAVHVATAEITRGDIVRRIMVSGH